MSTYIINSFAKIPKITSKTIMISTGGLFFSLGFYRGCEQYNYNYMKCINKKPEIEDYLRSFTFGLISASFYVNPALCGFAVYSEYKKIKMFVTDKYDENEYYNNLFFGKKI